MMSTVAARLKGPDLPADSLERLMAFRKELRGRNYERSKLELLKAAYDGTFSQNREDLSSIFCSELVAEAYQRLGLFTESRPSNEYRPEDFSSKKLRNLQNGYSLGDEIILKDE